MQKSNRSSIQVAFIRAGISEEQVEIIMPVIEEVVDDERSEAMDSAYSAESYSQAMAYMYE